MVKKSSSKSGSVQPEIKKGRPPVAVKKKPLQLMLDPRYIEHFRKVAKKSGIEAQDLGRMALAAMVPDPFNSTPLESLKNLQHILGKNSK
jgi:hypothetical protein